MGFAKGKSSIGCAIGISLTHPDERIIASSRHPQEMMYPGHSHWQDGHLTFSEDGTTAGIASNHKHVAALRHLLSFLTGRAQTFLMVAAVHG